MKAILEQEIFYILLHAGMLSSLLLPLDEKTDLNRLAPAANMMQIKGTESKEVANLKICYRGICTQM